MKKGFTLIELLFTLAIISIIAGVGVLKMSGSAEKADKTAVISEIRQAITEIQVCIGQMKAGYKYKPNMADYDFDDPEYGAEEQEYYNEDVEYYAELSGDASYSNCANVGAIKANVFQALRSNSYCFHKFTEEGVAYRFDSAIDWQIVQGECDTSPEIYQYSF